MSILIVLATVRVDAGALMFGENQPGEAEYALQKALPPGFGAQEFSLTFDVRLANEYAIGETTDGDAQRRLWSQADPVPYSVTDWWFAGNFLLDGHNNAEFSAGTFSVQIYGGGRVRWLLGDGDSRGQIGQLIAVQAHPANRAPSLLDGRWHRVALIRRAERAGAMLELWVDAALVAQSRVARMVDLRLWWNEWKGYKAKERGWFWGTEKQAAVGELRQWEDYKGLLDNVGFWTRALTPSELQAGMPTDTKGLAAMWHFDERSGSAVCDALSGKQCWQLVDPRADLLSEGGAAR